MKDYSNIEAQLEHYSEVFDFYMDSGDLPPSVGADDRLGAYIKTVIDNHPQADNTDPLRAEVLKDNLMGYMDRVLNACADLQMETERELAIIDEFENADIDKKRRMWGPISASIQQKYTRYQVDIPGFTQQFATADREAVFAALISDWRAACLESCAQRQQRVHNESSRQWEMSLTEILRVDYEERRHIAETVFRYPKLQEIIDIIGRDHETADQEDNIVYSFLPAGARTGLPSEDIDSIETGDNIQRTIASEFAMPDDLFYKRLACKELQQLASPRQRRPRKTEEHRPKPRPKKGPIIVGIDTSGSMYGTPEQIAKAMLIELVKMARRDRRSCYLITFSVRVRTLDLGRSANIIGMKQFLDTHFTGGNGEERLMTEALRLLETKSYEMADVLIISDFIFNPPSSADVRRVERAKALGTRFYGLQINSTSRAYDPILDRKWHVKA